MGVRMFEIDTRAITRFSIVLPTYNSEPTLYETLESIFIQRWPNVEVIVVDGGSKDQTVEIANNYAGLEMIVISEPDKGIYDAINKGIARATGDLICVVGSDDRLADGAFSIVHDTWSIRRTDIVAGRALLESPNGSVSLRLDEAYGVGALVSGIPFCHNSMFVTPETYRKVGSYSLNYKICADADWVHRSIRNGCTCSRVEQVLVHFSLSGTSSVNDELIMTETYAVVASNFPGLTMEEAEILFKAVRRWTDASAVPAILARHQENSALAKAVLEGLNSSSIEHAIDRIVNDSPAVKSFSEKALGKVIKFFKHGSL